MDNYKLSADVLQDLQGDVMTKNAFSPEDFEELSMSIVSHLFQNTNARITRTRSNKDGGYDIVVECSAGLRKQCAFFECKLRKDNLNLRDIAANAIIAFNHGAVALVAITNHDFTQQAGEELLDFCMHTVLNIKIISGKEIRRLAKTCGITIPDSLREYFDAKGAHRVRRKADFHMLQINFENDILQQLFDRAPHNNLIGVSLMEQLFCDEIKCIVDSIQNGCLVAVSGYLGVGKHEVIQTSLAKTNSRVILIDALLHDTKDLVVLDMLAQIWGMPSSNIFSSFSQNDVTAITEEIGGEKAGKETIEALTALLNENYADKRATARQNALLSNYIIRLIDLHKETIRFVFYIKKMQFANREIYDFLMYFVKYLAEFSIGCVVSYQEPEYKVQESINPLNTLQHLEKYNELNIKPLSEQKALCYVQSAYPELPLYVTQMIIKRVGTRLFNLSYLLRNLLLDSRMLPSHSKAIIYKLDTLTSNNIPQLVAHIMPQLKNIYPALFEACYIFGCRLPLEICKYLSLHYQDLDNLVDAGIFECDRNILVPKNEFIREWIMSAYLHTSPSIQLRATALNDILKKLDSHYNAERISVYRILGRYKEALELLDIDIMLLRRNKQYTLLRRELILAIEIARLTHMLNKEVEYIVSLLEVLYIQKEIGTSEVEQHISRLEDCTKHISAPKYCSFALTYFLLKRALKYGYYTREFDTSLEIGQKYYTDCLQKRLVDNNGDWLGKICCCYALLIKETQGNSPALQIFEGALKIFPDSFELHREYLSHVACMQLYEEPLSAYNSYSKILELFEKKAPDSAALPFHEYGDLAMSQLMANNFEHAFELASEAIEICRSNGLPDEEGRCLNIRGCAEWCLSDLSSAESSFREATAVMSHSEYVHYAWRSQLNLLQLSLMTGSYEKTRLDMLETLYSDFRNLLADKIRVLAMSDFASFRKTREYHALLALGALRHRLANDNCEYSEICDDFNLGAHDTFYKKDLCSFLSGNYRFMASPYIQNGYIYFVG